MVIRALLATLALTLTGTAAHAQEWPSKPVRIVTGFTAGGIGDLGARLLADHITRTTGQQAIVENRTGAAGSQEKHASEHEPAESVSHREFPPRAQRAVVHGMGASSERTPRRRDPVRSASRVRRV